MTHIHYVPIEPLTERYTEQWYRRFPEEFDASGFTVGIIDGLPLIENEIKVGAFLDINSTVHYKMSQLQYIAKMFHEGVVRNGDIFFFGDIEFWGLESVRLMADMNKVSIKIVGFLHAASYTKEDAFAIAAPYQKYTEVGWLAACDKVFVGSEYHKQAVIDRRLKPLAAEALADRIVVTKNPLFLDEYPEFKRGNKRKKVLMTNRFDEEKRPWETLRLFERLQANYPDWEFVVCTGRKSIQGSTKAHELLVKLANAGKVTIKTGLTKEQYHRELDEAYMVVSHSPEENYGYCIAEAIIYGCVPLLKNSACHPEFVGSPYLFNQWSFRATKDHVDDPHVEDSNSDYYKAAKWMARFGQPHRLTVDENGMQNIINELRDL